MMLQYYVPLLKDHQEIPLEHIKAALEDMKQPVKHVSCYQMHVRTYTNDLTDELVHYFMPALKEMYIKQIFVGPRLMTWLGLQAENFTTSLELVANACFQSDSIASVRYLKKQYLKSGNSAADFILNMPHDLLSNPRFPPIVMALSYVEVKHVASYFRCDLVRKLWILESAAVQCKCIAELNVCWQAVIDLAKQKMAAEAGGAASGSTN